MKKSRVSVFLLDDDDREWSGFSLCDLCGTSKGPRFSWPINYNKGVHTTICLDCLEQLAQSNLNEYVFVI